MLLNIPQAQGNPSTRVIKVQDVNSDEAEKSWLGGIRGGGKKQGGGGWESAPGQCLRLRAAPGAVGSTEAAVATQL